jgi:NDP-sugar pyrophosphorylase family protein
MPLRDQIGNLSQVTAVVLAGGLGTRLRPVVSDQPKVLAPVWGRPFLAYLLDQITAAGVSRVVVCGGYLGDHLEAAFHGSYRGAALRYSLELSPLGTAGALRMALPMLESDPVLVLNGDSFCDANLNEFYGWHQTRGAQASLLLAAMPDTRRYGRVHVDPDGKVHSFEEKGDAVGQGLINAGIYLLGQDVLRGIPAHVAVSLEREVLPAWVGRDLYAYQESGAFLDIGTPESYASAEQFFRVRRFGWELA